MKRELKALESTLESLACELKVGTVNFPKSERARVRYKLACRAIELVRKISRKDKHASN